MVDFSIIINQGIGAVVAIGTGLVLTRYEYHNRRKNERHNWNIRILRLSEKIESTLYDTPVNKRQVDRLIRYQNNLNELVTDAPFEIENELYFYTMVIDRRIDSITEGTVNTNELYVACNIVKYHLYQIDEALTMEDFEEYHLEEVREENHPFWGDYKRRRQERKLKEPPYSSTVVLPS